MSILANLVARLRGLFRGAREDAETQEELRFHLEMEMAMRVDPMRVLHTE